MRGRWLELAILRLRLRPGLARGLTAGLGVATVLLGGWLLLRQDDPAPSTRADPVEASAIEPAAGVPHDLPTLAVGPEPEPATEAALPRDCPALAARATEGGPDAVLLAWLCPDHPLDPVTARAALLAVRSPDEAAALAPRLADHPALAGLARLVAQGPVTLVDAPLPDPAQAAVSPVDDAVLAQVARAHALVAARGIDHGTRTRARALLAKTYLQATQQLGVGVGRPPEPFARLLAGRALHYGRLFCLSYWQGRVAGLAALFGEVEQGLPTLAIALEGSPHHGDAARAAVELDEARRYVTRDGPRERLERRRAERRAMAWGPERLRPLPNELDRLLELGFVDLAIARALDEAARPDGPGLRPMEQLLRDAVARAERGESLALLDLRLSRARARTTPPPEHGTGHTAHAAELPWPRAEAVAEEAAAWIERAPPGTGLPRRYALGRALLLIRSRPDALVLLLDRTTADDASPALRAASAWLEPELAARDDGRLPWLQRRVAAQVTHAEAGTDDARPIDHAAEADRRRRYAVRMREADRQPRGPGLIQ